MGFQIPHQKGQFWGKEEPIVSIGTFCRELCNYGRTDEFAVWIVDSGGPKEAQVNRIRQVAHWRHLSNTIETSVCGSNAVLCEITLTTCYISYLMHMQELIAKCKRSACLWIHSTSVPWMFTKLCKLVCMVCICCRLMAVHGWLSMPFACCVWLLHWVWIMRVRSCCMRIRRSFTSSISVA